MSDDLLPTTDVLDPAPRKRGRKPGCEKIPGSGRKPGGKNKVPKDLRQMILERGKPLELLCDISRGVKIRVGPQAGPGEAQYQYPTLTERAAAAKILCDKLIAAAPSSPPAEGTEPPPPELFEPGLDPNLALARRVAFLLKKGEAAAKSLQPAAERPSQPAPVSPVTISTPEPTPEPEQPPQHPQAELHAHAHHAADQLARRSNVAVLHPRRPHER
jgi:hypothetical protein